MEKELELVKKQLSLKKDAYNTIRRNYENVGDLLAKEKQEKEEISEQLKHLEAETEILRENELKSHDFQKTKKENDILKKFKEDQEIRIDQLILAKKQTEHRVEGLRDEILIYQEQIQEAEQAIQHQHEERMILEDENKVLKKKFLKASESMVHYERELKKKKLELSFGDDKMTEKDKLIVESKQRYDKLKRDYDSLEKLKNEVNYQEKEEKMSLEAQKWRTKCISIAKKNQEQQDTIEKYEATLKLLTSKNRKRKNLLKEVQKINREKENEIIITKQKNDRLSHKKNELTKLKIEKEKVIKENKILKLELKQFRNKVDFNDSIQEQLEIMIIQNDELKKQLKEKTKAYTQDIKTIQEKYLKEKERLNFGNIFDKLNEKEKQIQTTIMKLINTEKANESALTCLHCLKIFDAPRICVPCGHVFCSNCLRDAVICFDCKKKITHSYYVTSIDTLSGKMEYKRQTLRSLLIISKKRIIPQEQIDVLKNKYQTFEKETDGNILKHVSSYDQLKERAKENIIKKRMQKIEDKKLKKVQDEENKKRLQLRRNYKRKLSRRNVRGSKSRGLTVVTEK